MPIVTIPYRPRDAFKPFHFSGKRWSVMVAHRRSGKSVACVNHLIRKALEKPKSNFAFIAPNYKMAKRIVWEYVKEFTAPVVGTKPNESELKCSLPNGSMLYLLGSEDPDSLRGMALDGVVFDEYQLQPPEVFGEIIRPALADRAGFAVFCGTTFGKNHFYKLFESKKSDPDWFSLWLTASKSGILPQSELDDARKLMTEAEYLQEFELEPTAANRGAIFGNEMRWLRENGRIREVPVESYAPVDTYWDLGIGDYLVVTFMQSVGMERRIIDHYSTHSTSLAEVAKELRTRGYNYGTHYLPHDSKARELQTGVTREQFLRNALVGNVEVVTRPKTKEESLDAFRLNFKKLWISEKCENLIECLEMYSQEWDDDLKVFKNTPKHDWTSHSSDSVQLWGLIESRRALDDSQFAQSSSVGYASGNFEQTYG